MSNIQNQKMSYKLSKIESIYLLTQQKLETRQYLKLIFQLYDIEKVEKHNYISTSLVDSKYSCAALMVEQAQAKLQTLSATCEPNLMIIKLEKWKLCYKKLKNLYYVVVYEFQYVGKNDEKKENPEFHPDVNEIRPRKRKMKWQQLDCDSLLNEDSQFLSESLLWQDPQSGQYSQTVQYSQCQNKKVRIEQGIQNVIREKTNNKEKKSYITLEGKVINISEKLTYKDKSTEQLKNYFKIAILDHNSTIWTGIFFEDTFECFTQLKENSYYYFQNGKINTNSCSQIVFNIFSTITPLQQPLQFELPEFKYQTILEILHSPNFTLVDLFAIIDQEVFEDENRKTYIVMDKTGSVYLTFWKNLVNCIQFKIGDVIGMKGLRFNCGSTKNYLNLEISTVIIKQIDQSKVDDLVQWWISRNFGHIKFNKNESIQQFQEYVEQQQQGFYVIEQKCIIGKIVHIQHNQATYNGCSKCKKVLKNIGGQRFQCQKCSLNFDNSLYLFHLYVTIQDNTSFITATIFDEVAKKLLAKTASEFQEVSPQNRINILKTCMWQNKIFTIEGNQNQQQSLNFIVSDIQELINSEISSGIVEREEVMSFIHN